MALRRPSWPRSCLCQVSPLREARQDPPSRWVRSGAAGRRRHLASIASHDPPPSNQNGTSSNSRDEHTTQDLLGNLLGAIHTKDDGATNKAFLAWTRALDNKESPAHGALVEEFVKLPSPVLSEIIRSMDPLERPNLDVLHGLSIRQGQLQYTDVGKLMDRRGARLHHRRVLRGMEIILNLREKGRFRLRPADFNTMLRCAGAGFDRQKTTIFYRSMEQHQMINSRTPAWIDFLKARYMLHPTYYQYDRTRVAANARSLIAHQPDTEDWKETVWRMDRVLIAMSAFSRLPWNRARDDSGQDIRYSLGRRTRAIEYQGDGYQHGDQPHDAEIALVDDYRSFYAHFVRQQKLPRDVTEELLCTSIMGFSRAADRRAILDLILKNYYDIEVDEENQTVTGGKDLPDDSPMRPTERLLFALVEAFGAMAEISLCMRLVDFVSQRYNVPITPEVWSNLLNWAYVSGTKVLRTLRNIKGESEDTSIDVSDVHHIYNIMTSPPYSVKPSFEDLEICIKAHIIRHNISEAIDLIGNTVMPYYNTLVEEFEASVLDEILLKDSILDPSTDDAIITRPMHRRHRAESRKDYVQNCIATWFNDILKEISGTRSLRTSDYTSVHIPNLVRDFPHFFFTGVRYRTPTGSVVLKGHNDSRRFQWEDGEERRVIRERMTLPKMISGALVKPSAVNKYGVTRKMFDEETRQWVKNPNYWWPRVDRMRIREKRRIPRKRYKNLPRPPAFDDDMEVQTEWWSMLEGELML